MPAEEAPDGDVLAALAKEAQRLVEPLARCAHDPQGRRRLLLSLGWDIEKLTGFPVEELEDAAEAVARSASEVADLASLRTVDLAAAQELVEAVAAVVQGVRQLQELAGASTLDVPAEVAEALGGIGQALVEVLVADWLAAYHPVVHDVLRVLTLLDASDDRATEPTPPLTDGSSQVVYRRSAAPPRFRLERLPDLLADPAALLRAQYVGDELATVADAHAAATRLFSRIAPLLVALGAGVSNGADVPGVGGDPDVDPARTLAVRFPLNAWDADAALGAVLQIRSDDEGGAALVVMPSGWADHRIETRSWLVEIALGGQLGTFSIGTDGVDVSAGSALSLDVAVQRVPDSDDGRTIIGAPEGTRLELGPVRLGIGLDVDAEDWDAELSAQVGASALVLGGGDTDGFLASVLPKEGLRIPFDTGVVWSRSGGLRFDGGGAGLELSVPVHTGLGPLQVRTVGLSLGPDGADVVLAATLTADVRLGPVTAAVEEVGVELVLSFPAEGGDLGPVDLDVRLRPPTGAGLAIDAGPVTGGGYLFFDHEAGQYAGVVQLEFQAISVTAIGLLTTRMPDGRKSFSLLAIVSAELPPIQLGMGFTLNGVGGLLGVNRTAAVDPLREGVRSGAVDAVMFPPDPVKNAPTIIKNLATYFPPTPGRFVFGPMARIGWGTPTLITLDIGLVLDLPAPVRLLVLGRLRLVLPEERAAVVSITMDVLGVVDFERREASVDATIRDSHIAGFALTGDMAMRMSWSGSPTFALAAGGFNPRFSPPPGFPALRRLALALATGDNPRLRLEAYLALTSNTAQLGARVDLYAEALGFSVSGHLGFDALFRFSPFEVVVDMRGALALKRGTKNLMAVTVDVTLSGPNPWHARGRATFKVWIFEGEVAFDVTVGQRTPEPAIPPVQPGTLLARELATPGNWSAQLPPQGESLVTLRALEPGEREVLAHPLGTLAFQQRAVPLGVRIDKVGNAPVTGDRVFSVTHLRLGDTEAPPAAPLHDSFAPGQFLDLTDDEKLSRPSFELMESGRRFSSPAPEVDPEGESLPVATVGYETVLVDSPDAPARPAGTIVLTGDVLARLALVSAAGQAAPRRTGARRFAAPTTGIAVRPATERVSP